MRGLFLWTMAAVAAVSAKTILHISDVHLNLTLDEIKYKADTSPRLFESALAYAQTVLASPDFFLYTGDAVAHMDHNESFLAQSVAVSVSTMQKYFHVVANATAILGNADCVLDYEFNVTDPTTTTTNPTIGTVDQVWRPLLSPSHFAQFDARGYLWYNVEPRLVLITLNTVPYSPKHFPNTTAMDDPFDQFQWLRATLAAVRANQSFAYIAGHIPPIIDSYTGSAQWVPKYIVAYKAIVRDFPDIIKAQLFGHVHSIEYRLPQDNLGAPLFTSGAISPLFGNNPSFTIWEYDNTTFDLLDYTVFATNLTKHSNTVAWKRLYRASLVYNLSSLTTPPLASLSKRMVSDPTLRNAYYRHSKADSPAVPPCDDSVCLARVLCTQTWFDTEAQFRDCVAAHAPPPASRLLWFWVVPATAAIVAVVTTLVLLLRRILRRSTYQTIDDDASSVRY
ncbi:Aste57867_7264 [Aphanomyces stellatus]|uniref:Aste57867_7264 protein n=1 Tax=Aphanomyces stellatus TaxID=120398 RepID=A0A485KI24_9STRA|nr:hypothetical protein As57867_007239 [Aphanomyces stellatus]VFT84186.1 Aste57867_7264 [Aphanomyces stellatus]